jgi:hypothetical protein
MARYGFQQKFSTEFNSKQLIVQQAFFGLLLLLKRTIRAVLD